MTATILVSFLICDAMLAGYLWAMPAPRHRQAFFGHRPCPGYPTAHDKRTLFRYRLALAICFACIESIAIAFMVHHWSILNLVQIRLASYAALITAGFADYIASARTIEPRNATKPIRLASSLKRRRLNDYTNIAFEGLVIAATLLPLALLAFCYRSIPAVVAAAGHSEWVPKSFRLVFGLPIIALYLQGLVFILKRLMVRATVALPAEHADEHLRLKEETIRTYARMWDMFRGLIAVTAILNFRLLIRTPGQADLFSRIGVVLGFIVGVSAIAGFLCLMSRLSRLYRDLKNSTGHVYVARPADSAHWHAGGLIYYNRLDPAVFTETPVGANYATSYALNLANPRAYPVFLYLASLPVVLGWFLGVF
jgi:uncharacterized membrane protein